MPRYRYIAIDATGTRGQGEMEAADEASVVRAVQRAGSIIVRDGIGNPARPERIAEF